MTKLFDERNLQKKMIDQSRRKVFVNEREIWLAHLGVNVRHEIDGKGDTYERPVLILKKLGGLFLILPMTTGGNEGPWYYDLPHTIFGKRSRLILSQIKVVDRNRFARKIRKIDHKLFYDIKEKLKTFLF